MASKKFPKANSWFGIRNQKMVYKPCIVVVHSFSLPTTACKHNFFCLLNLKVLNLSGHIFMKINIYLFFTSSSLYTCKQNDFECAFSDLINVICSIESYRMSSQAVCLCYFLISQDKLSFSKAL